MDASINPNFTPKSSSVSVQSTLLKILLKGNGTRVPFREHNWPLWMVH
jgi:hypothetical protein